MEATAALHIHLGVASLCLRIHLLVSFGDPARPHPCNECLLMRFVPAELKDQAHRAGSSHSLTKMRRLIILSLWHTAGTGRGPRRLAAQATQSDRRATRGSSRHSALEELLEGAGVASWSKSVAGVCGKFVFRGQPPWPDHNYVTAHALYGRALVAAEKVEALRGSRMLSCCTNPERPAGGISRMLSGGERSVAESPV